MTGGSGGRPARIASHNVLYSLGPTQAQAAVARIMGFGPDVVGLQEWGRGRRRLLRRFGRVVVYPRLRRLTRRRFPADGFVWVYPIGGQPVGVDASRWIVVGIRRVKLAVARRGVRATYGTEVKLRPRHGGPLAAVLNLHLVAHHDRPANLAAWQEGLASVEDWADSWHGYRCWVLGDFNKKAPRIHGLKSCCDGRRDPATFRGRPIDHIYGRDGFALVTVAETASDHHGLIAQEPPTAKAP